MIEEPDIDKIARSSAVSVDFLRKILRQPNDYFNWSGSHWSHKNKERNSESELLDKWCDRAIGRFIHDGTEPLRNDPSVVIYELGICESKPITTKDIVVQHLPNRYVLKMDISHFFESITFDMVKKSIPTSLHGLIERIYFTDNGGLRRGLCASPRIAEIIGRKIENKIQQTLHENKIKDKVIFTRYCDDLQFSSNDRETLRLTESKVETAIQGINLIVNEDKTKLIPLSSNTILGLRIHNGNIIISKKYKNKARIRVYNALKSFDQCDRSQEDDLIKSITLLESAIGTLGYIIQYNDNEKSRQYIDILQSKRKTLLKDYDELNDEQPLLY